MDLKSNVNIKLKQSFHSHVAISENKQMMTTITSNREAPRKTCYIRKWAFSHLENHQPSVSIPVHKLFLRNLFPYFASVLNIGLLIIFWFNVTKSYKYIPNTSKWRRLEDKATQFVMKTAWRLIRRSNTPKRSWLGDNKYNDRNEVSLIIRQYNALERSWLDY